MIFGNGSSGIDTGVYSYTRIINSTISGNSGSEKRINTVPGRFDGGVYVSLQAGVLILNRTISGNSADFGSGCMSAMSTVELR